MNNMYKLAIPLMGSLLFTSTAVSQVVNISGDSLVQYGKEDAYWVSEVTCADESKRVVQHKTDGELWCGKSVEGFCDKTKESAAKKICSSQYAEALSQIEATRKAQQRAKDQQAERERAQQRRLADERIVQQRIEREQRAAAEEPIRKQINIEEELILIEQEKLELRRQELELQRRAAEIEAQLKAGSKP